MTINKLTDNVYVLNNTKKINEIIDAINSNPSITIDSELSASSENPVQNKVITTALSEKQDIITIGTGLSLSGTTLNHINSISAGTVGTSEASSGATISIPYISYDAQGHITGKGEATHTVTGFLTEHQSLSEYALLTDIPQSISAFDNDAGYLTSHQDLSEYYTKSELDGKLSAAMHYKGTLATVASLSEVENPQVGDMYNITSTGANYAYDGEDWDKLSENIDLSSVVPNTRKINDKALSSDITLSASDVGALPDSTAIPVISDTYTSTSSDGMSGKAVYSAISTKQDTISNLATIISNASEGAAAALTISSYGDIVTHNASEFLTEHQSLSEYAALSELSDVAITGDYGDLINTPTIPVIPSEISSFNNDAGYITETDLSEYALLIDIPNNISEFNNDIGYLTEHQDLSEYALLTNIPESVSQLANDSGFITIADLSEYALSVNIPESISAFTNDVGYLTEHQDLSGYALLTDIPESISAFANDVGYITEHQSLSEYQKIETAVVHESNTAVGNTTTPIYITSSGVASELSYTIAKSVPSDAVFTDTTYTAGTGISISNEGVISSTQSSAEWGNITGDLSEQTDLMTALSEKQDIITPGDGISITNNVISTTSNYCYSASCPAITPVNGTAEWTITHNLGTQNVSVTLYSGTQEIKKKVTIVSDNSLTVTFKDNQAISAEDYKVVILAKGGTTPSGIASVESEFPLFFSTWSPIKMSDKWVKADGTFLSGSTYLTQYTYLVNVLNESIQNPGISVKTISDTYNDYDFVLNTSAQTFRLPLLNGEEDRCYTDCEQKELLTVTINTVGFSWVAPYNCEIAVSMIANTSSAYLYIGTGYYFHGTSYHANESGDNLQGLITVKKGETLFVDSSNISRLNASVVYKLKGNGDLYFLMDTGSNS